MSKDKQGREYAKTNEVKLGSKVVVDGDFTCIEPWTIHEVQVGEDEMLYIPCHEGQHYLSGELSEDGTFYVGVYPA